MTEHLFPSTSSSAADHRIAATDSLLGLAVGDAFGAQFFVPENLPALRERRLPDGPWPWTDDTEMACSVLSVLREDGSVDPGKLAGRFAEQQDYGRGYGAAMLVLLHGVRKGGWWRDLAEGLFDGQGSWGNGAAMRVAPLGAWFAVDPAEAAWQAARSARATHTHPEAVAGAVAVAVAAAVVRDAVSGHQMIEAAVELTPQSKVRDGVAEALELLDQPYVELAAHRLGNGRLVSAIDTVPFTLWCAARNLDDYAAALWDTASAGGDVDTTCAIVGGILGARVGAAGIPEQWRAATEVLPQWLASGPAGGVAARPFVQARELPVPELRWTPGQLQRVRDGAGDAKWQARCEGERLVVSRASGERIFELRLDAGAAWVESNRAVYRRGTDAAETATLELLLDRFFGHEPRPELAERQLRLRYGG
ncbi:ADP-ribosylglycohydrolase family protein [Kitasatospora sp. NPDC006697]|uniref:ADP-ribosylglycohydrolase family protein n=1 Tax=Kitasatospora sp. NPDC006697 TaxID=3364020 RepID=UPI0036C7DA6E